MERCKQWKRWKQCKQCKKRKKYQLFKHFELFITRCYLHLWWCFSHFVSILIYIDSFILVEARICKRFISISNCETFTNYQIYHLRKYLRPTLCLNKSLLLPKPSVLINLGTNDMFPGKFSELWQRYEQIEPFTPQAANIKQEPNILYSNR